MKPFVILFLITGVVLPTVALAQEQRVPWTTSRVVGTPEPPLPYVGERVFPKLQWRQPLEVTCGLGRLFVVERWGRISSFVPKPDAAQFDTLIEMRSRKGKPAEATFGFALDPDVRKNRYVYICYATVKRGEDTTHLSRFTLKSLDPPVADPDSEQILLKFDSGPHNGACVRFGPDGMLYVSTGDAMPASPPDGKKTGQDISDFESSILRIDVRQPDPATGKPYRVPPDNPFVKTPGAKPEVYAFGLRQPWKMAFEPGTNHLWVGDVGWNRWEMIHRVTPGYNGGWSVAEGPEVIRADGKRGPAPVTHAIYSYSHSDGASITGGYVYRGKRLPKLKGAYIFGDHENGMIRAIRFNKDGKFLGKEDLAQASVGVATFGEAANGDFYFANFRQGTMHRLGPNPAHGSPRQAQVFPRTLGASGLFTDVAKARWAPGVYDYQINSPLWSGGASIQHHLAIPGRATLAQRRRGAWPRPVAPSGTVLVRTLSLPSDQTGKDPKRIETQMMHFDGNVWRGYTYKWRADQSDADLVPAKGETASVMNRGRKMDWVFHSRADCMRCHHDPRFLLSFLNDQLVRPDKKQADRFQKLKLASKEYFVGGRLIPLSETKASLDRRVRSYLHANCTSCHLDGGGGANVRLRIGPPVTHNFMLEKPTRGDFGLDDARVVVPGAPEKSVLFYRMATGGSGRMPPIGPHPSDPFHAAGEKIGAHNQVMLRAVHDWIMAMKPTKPVQVTAASIPNDLKTPSGALRVFVAQLRGELNDAAWKMAVARGAASTNPTVSGLFEPYLPEDQRVLRLGMNIDAAKLLAIVGDAAKGAKLFAADGKARCGTCHTAGDKGALIGPDLTKLAARMKPDAILRSILEPAAEVKPTFQLKTLMLKDGRTIAGFVSGDGTLAVRTLDGKLHKVSAADVKRTQTVPGSTMPPGLLANLTAQEAADLLAFLNSLK